MANSPKIYLRPKRGKGTTASRNHLLLRRGEVFLEIPETGYSTDLGKIKVGDGFTEYSQLEYFLDNSRLGTKTVGSSTNPIYLENGTPKRTEETIGSGIKPIYLKSGNLTSSDSIVGSKIRPIYMENGSIKAIDTNYAGDGTYADTTHLADSDPNAAVDVFYGGTGAKNFRDAAKTLHNATFKVTLLDSDWTQEASTGYWVARKAVTGVRGDMNYRPPYVIFTRIKEKDDEMKKNLGLISTGETEDGYVTLICYGAKPTYEQLPQGFTVYITEANEYDYDASASKDY